MRLSSSTVFMLSTHTASTGLGRGEGGGWGLGLREDRGGDGRGCRNKPGPPPTPMPGPQAIVGHSPNCASRESPFRLMPSDAAHPSTGTSLPSPSSNQPSPRVQDGQTRIGSCEPKQPTQPRMHQTTLVNLEMAWLPNGAWTRWRGWGPHDGSMAWMACLHGGM